MIELLVVIAIIAILASLLFPALTGSVERAHVTSCMSNLRKLVTAASAYEVDHGGRMPTPWTVPEKLWRNSLGYYVGEKPCNERIEDGDPVEPGVFTCPQQFKLAPYHWTYAMNSQAQTARQGQETSHGDANSVKKSWMLRPGSVKSPWPVLASTIPYFLDGWYSATTGSNSGWRHHGGGGGPNNPEVWPLNYPHMEAVNIAFLDGHVERVGRYEGMWGPEGGRMRYPDFWRYLKPDGSWESGPSHAF